MRVATAVLIVLVGSIILHAQRLEPTRPAAPHVIAGNDVAPQRSGPVCLKSVPVDASIDPAFVKPVPTTGLAARIIEMPPCVTLGSPQP